MKGNVIVTGGAGYIGSHTCVELINAGYTPIIIDNFSNSENFIIDRINEITNSNVEVIERDCRDVKFLSKELAGRNYVGCIHFAAYKAVGESSQKPLKYYQNNIDSLLSILELSEVLSIKSLVFSSSCTVYGEPDTLPVTEISQIKKAESPYGRTKQMCEDILEDYIKSGATLNALSLRYFNPIGAHPSSLIGELPLGTPNNLVPFITQTAAGIRKELTVFGNDYNTPDGTCIRDYIHVVDLAKAHVASVRQFTNLNYHSYDKINIGTGRGNSVMDVIKTFEEVNNLKLNYQVGLRRDGDIEKVFADSSKAQKLLNWKSKLSLRDALKDAWNWQKTL